MMLVARVLLKKTKPLDFTACLAAASSTCSSSSSSLLCCNPQQNGYLTTTTTSFAILSDSDSYSFNNNLKSAFSLSRSFSDSKPRPKPTAAPLSDDSSGDDEEEEYYFNKLIEKDQLHQAKCKEILDRKDQLLRTFPADKDQLLRTFADVEITSRASSALRQCFEKIHQNKDTKTMREAPSETLLEIIDMTSEQKQFVEVFKELGYEKYDPLDEQFDPHRHKAVLQVPDASKPPGTVAVVLKSGYMLHGSIIRPAEVGVTQAVESNEAEQGSKPKPKPTAAPLSDDSSGDDEEEDHDDSSGDDEEEDHDDSSGDDEEEDLSTQDLIKIVYEKDQLFQAKYKQILDLKDQILRTYPDKDQLLRTIADMEILCRASSVIRQRFENIDQSQDTKTLREGVLKTLREGLDMTSKQNQERFKKLGYTLHDRIIRPAEVGVTQAVESNEAEQGSET